jgi:uncharacterized cupin superfamily protein
MSAQYKFNLNTDYLRLRPDCTVEPLPVRDDFWPRLMAGKLGVFHNEYLVSTATYDKDWTSWERHPAGDEIVCLLSGSLTMLLERPEGVVSVALSEAGDYVRVPANTWHTAKTSTPAGMLFFTAGEGTDHRPVA